MDYYEKKTYLPIVVWPSKIWIGGPGEEHGGGYPYDFEPGGEFNRNREQPLAHGYYDSKMKALQWYGRPGDYEEFGVGKPPMHILQLTVRLMRKEGFEVRILDKTAYMKARERYPKRDFRHMRRESVMGMDTLVEMRSNYHKYRPKPLDNAYISPSERSKVQKQQRTRWRKKLFSGRMEHEMTRDDLIESILEAVLKAKKRSHSSPVKASDMLGDWTNKTRNQ